MKTENVENAHIEAKNLSAYWIPPITAQEVIRGTTYIVTGSYDGIVPFTHTLERIMARKLAEEIRANVEIVESAEEGSENGGLADDRSEEL